MKYICIMQEARLSAAVRPALIVSSVLALFQKCAERLQIALWRLDQRMVRRTGEGLKPHIGKLRPPRDARRGAKVVLAPDDKRRAWDACHGLGARLEPFDGCGSSPRVPSVCVGRGYGFGRVSVRRRAQIVLCHKGFDAAACFDEASCLRLD